MTRTSLFPALAILTACSDNAGPGSGNADRTPPTLLDRRPQPDQEGVWVYAPITLTFSEPLAASSVVPAAFEVRADDEAAPLAVEARLGEDRRAVTVRLVRAPRGPTRLTLTVGSGLRDDAGNTFAGARWSWRLPLWHQAAIPGAEQSSLPAAAEDGGDLVVAWREASGVKVARHGEAGWAPIGTPLAAGALAPPRVAITAAGPVVGWTEGGDLALRRWDGARWAPLGEAPPDGAAEARDGRLVVDASGTLHAGWLEGDRLVQVARWEGGVWRPAAKGYATARSVASFDVTIHEGRPVLAVCERSTDTSDLTVVAWDAAGATWRRLGAPLDRVAADEVAAPVLATAGGALAVAWQEHDGLSHHVYAARLEQGEWTLLGPALDLEIDADATAPQLRLGRDGEPLIAWRESATTYVARWRGGRWEPLGRFAGGEAPLALVIDGRGEPALVDRSGASLAVRRFNGTTELPFGLTVPSAASPCRLPDERDPAFPRTLGATGCFTDLVRRVPAAGVVPYAVISALWSDGAEKRRFVVLPPGEAFEYHERDSWGTPPGTIFIKEFLVEGETGAPLVAMETRLLVKRCEEGDCEMPWQGYSFQWNDAGTDATLLTNDKDPVFKDWRTPRGTHRHTYPGQTQCGQCHLLAAGGTLGLQTSQLNRSFDYGDFVDNQLRALSHAGALRGALPDLAAAPRVPAPHDVGFSVERRVRGYFQGNCAHCHRPAGAWPVMDFRFHVSLAASRLCELIKPGNAAASRLFIKSQTRDIEKLPDGTTGRPMPPIGSLVLDERQLVLLRGWIDGMKSCP